MPASINICNRRSFRNRRGVCFFKRWATQKARGPISEIEEALAFSKVGLLRDHEGRSQKSKKHLFFQPRQHLSHAHSALRKLRAICRRFLVKHENFEVPATLLLPMRVKEQHHCLTIGKSLCVSTSVFCGKTDWQERPTFTHIREKTPNIITLLKAEAAPLSESREPDFLI
ncbi:hypothetical protein FF1_030965 [Malus domestica]